MKHLGTILSILSIITVVGAGFTVWGEVKTKQAVTEKQIEEVKEEIEDFEKKVDEQVKETKTDVVAEVKEVEGDVEINEEKINELQKFQATQQMLNDQQMTVNMKYMILMDKIDAKLKDEQE